MWWWNSASAKWNVLHIFICSIHLYIYVGTNFSHRKMQIETNIRTEIINLRLTVKNPHASNSNRFSLTRRRKISSCTANSGNFAKLVLSKFSKLHWNSSPYLRKLANIYCSPFNVIIKYSPPFQLDLPSRQKFPTLPKWNQQRQWLQRFPSSTIPCPRLMTSPQNH